MDAEPGKLALEAVAMWVTRRLLARNMGKSCSAILG
jgi:hypothetical protein